MGWVEYNIGLSWVEFEYNDSGTQTQLKGGEIVLKLNSTKLKYNRFFWGGENFKVSRTCLS
jgi:hypothetical protein